MFKACSDESAQAAHPSVTGRWGISLQDCSVTLCSFHIGESWSLLCFSSPKPCLFSNSYIPFCCFPRNMILQSNGAFCFTFIQLLCGCLFWVFSPFPQPGTRMLLRKITNVTRAAVVSGGSQMSVFSFKYPKLKRPLFVILCVPAYTKIGQ